MVNGQNHPSGGRDILTSGRVKGFKHWIIHFPWCNPAVSLSGWLYPMKSGPLSSGYNVPSEQHLKKWSRQQLTLVLLCSCYIATAQLSNSSFKVMRVHVAYLIFMQEFTHRLQLKISIFLVLILAQPWPFLKCKDFPASSSAFPHIHLSHLPLQGPLIISSNLILSLTMTMMMMETEIIPTMHSQWNISQ